MTAGYRTHPIAQSAPDPDQDDAIGRFENEGGRVLRLPEARE